MFENQPKCRISVFQFWPFFGIFNELLSTQNVNIARFARNVEWDILSNFQTMCLKQDLVYATLQKLSHLRVKWGIEHLHLNFHPQLTSLLWVSIFALLAFQFPDYFLSRFSRAIKNFDCHKQCHQATVFENHRKKSHSTLRAKRATFTFWVDKSSLKMPKGQFGGQAVLPDR